MNSVVLLDVLCLFARLHPNAAKPPSHSDTMANQAEAGGGAGNVSRKSCDRARRSRRARRSLKSQMDTAAPRKRPAPAVTRRKKRDARPVCKKRGTARCGKRHRTATETPALDGDRAQSGQREATNVGSPQRGEMSAKPLETGAKPEPRDRRLRFSTPTTHRRDK